MKNLLRKEQARRRLPELIGFLNEHTGLRIDVEDTVSIEGADRIWSIIGQNVEMKMMTLSISFPYGEKGKFELILDCLKKILAGTQQYFTTAKFYTDCFLLLESTCCLNVYDQVIKFDGDGFYIYDKELKNGLSLESSEEHWRDESEFGWTYELKVYGFDWVDLVYREFVQVR